MTTCTDINQDPILYTLLVAPEPFIHPDPDPDPDLMTVAPKRDFSKVSGLTSPEHGICELLK
jgi:hypothetical protein